VRYELTTKETLRLPMKDQKILRETALAEIAIFLCCTSYAALSSSPHLISLQTRLQD
jgi:hypothetical protein